MTKREKIGGWEKGSDNKGERKGRVRERERSMEGVINGGRVERGIGGC